MPSGSKADSSTPPRTASTGIWTTARANKAAIIFEGEPGDVRTITYRQLHQEVCRFANALAELGLGKGDRVGHLHADGAGGGGRHARPAPGWGSSIR